MKKLLRALGYVPIGEVASAVEVAFLEADRERARRIAEERRFDEEYAWSPDGLADKLEAITGRIPVVLGEHGA